MGAVAPRSDQRRAVAGLDHAEPGQCHDANALEIAQRTFERERSRSGDKSLNTAVARGYYAVALARNSKPAEALQAFKESLPVLLTTTGGSDDDSGSTAAAREGRIRFVIEGYLRVLALNPSLAPANVAEETFGYADVLRGQAVQRALQASSARSATDNPELAKLIRTSQDGEKKIGAAVATLNNLLSLPPSERDEKDVEGDAGRDRRAAERQGRSAEGDREKIPAIRQPDQSAAAGGGRPAEATRR